MNANNKKNINSLPDDNNTECSKIIWVTNRITITNFLFNVFYYYVIN